MITLPPRGQGLSLAAHVSNCIEAGILPDYVYSYPPRQTFRPRPEISDQAFTSASLAATPDNFNLYLHFPFCRQICGFCNLFAVAAPTDPIVASYLKAICKEIQSYRDALPALTCRTLYFGGGTPSLLLPNQIEQVLSRAEKYFPGSWTRTEELCIEVAPDTLDHDKAATLKQLGFTRVSLGAQTLDDGELIIIGRHHLTDVTRKAIETALQTGFADVCVDVINGLPGQSRASWSRSVREVIDMRPPTVCTYNLTPRPATGFDAAGLTSGGWNKSDCAEWYERYTVAQELLLSSGYVQETNVRYIIPGRGGYRQKVYHWQGGTILGLGAGARTYTPLVHYNNGYSARRRREILLAYLMRMANSGHSRTEGFLLDDEERLRQRAVLSCHCLPRATITELERLPSGQGFTELVDWLVANKFAYSDVNHMTFTPRGFKYRDVISHALFSDKVRVLMSQYDYYA